MKQYIRADDAEGTILTESQLRALYRKFARKLTRYIVDSYLSKFPVDVEWRFKTMIEADPNDPPGFIDIRVFPEADWWKYSDPNMDGFLEVALYIHSKTNKIIGFWTRVLGHNMYMEGQFLEDIGSIETTKMLNVDIDDLNSLHDFSNEIVEDMKEVYRKEIKKGETK